MGGVRHATTILWLDRNIVLGHKTIEKHGYSAIQVAAGERKLKNVGKCVLGQYKHDPKLANSPPYRVREFRVTDEANLLPLNSSIHSRHFLPGQNVDVSGISKGKGFQGAMKRHNFRGMPATHGTSLSHRSLGSTGQCQDPGKVFKGKKMAGRMGTDQLSDHPCRPLNMIQKLMVPGYVTKNLCPSVTKIHSILIIWTLPSPLRHRHNNNYDHKN